MTFSKSNWLPQLSKYKLPAYKAISQSIKDAIADGTLRPGERLPTHRNLADMLSVTVGTVTRGYAEAERQHIIASKVGSGTFVAKPKNKQTEFKILNKEPGVVDLGTSLALPIDSSYLSDAYHEIIQRPGALKQLSQYLPENGVECHSHAHTRWLTLAGCQHIDPRRICTTMGGQHGLFLALSSVCAEGDTILCDQLTYPGLLAVAKKLKLKLIGLEADEQGLLAESVELACKRYRPRAMYLMTRLSTPTCHSFSESRINAISEIAMKYNFWILEDDVQGCMGPSSLPLFVNNLPELTIHITSVSKALVGGLRVGALYSPAKLVRSIQNTLRSQMLMLPLLSVELYSYLILESNIVDILNTQRQKLSSRNALATSIFSDYDIQQQPHSLSLLLTLPSNWQSTSFTEACRDEGLIIKPAEAFSISHQNIPNAIRISIGGTLDDDDFEKSLLRISDLLSQEPLISIP